MSEPLSLFAGQYVIEGIDDEDPHSVLWIAGRPCCRLPEAGVRAAEGRLCILAIDQDDRCWRMTIEITPQAASG